jgi:hypothetical protein
MLYKGKKFRSFNDYAIIQLRNSNLKFESRYNNSLIIIQGLRGSIEFYPGTGAFTCKSTGSRGRGIENVILYAKTGRPPF